MKIQLIYLTTALILFTGCTRYSPEIEDVLRQAGDNRSQLEKVLKHYSRKPADSLKLRAAEFLIANMPDKYSVEYDVPFENLMAFCIQMKGIESQQDALEAYGSMEPIIKYDVKYITGDYLINNIELSFKVWEEQPWGKDVPFDVFCEEILPYRVSNEPLENWRKKALTSYAKLNNSFKTQPGITVIEACTQVNSQLPQLQLSTDVPDMNFSMIMTATRGMCDEMVTLAIFTMRALGIPVSKDFVLKWPNHYVGHSWNSGYGGIDKRFSFMGTEENPQQEEHIYDYAHKSKIYRQTFAKQEHIKTDSSDIPAVLHDWYMKDVTHEYYKPDTLFHNIGGCEVEIPVKYQPSKNTGYAYLACRGKKTWEIVGWGETDTKTINFGMTGKNIMYLPLYCENGVQKPAHYPFQVGDNDSIHIFEPDTSNYRQFTVTEMSPATFNYLERMNNGVFEGANRDDFSDAKVLHTVKKLDGTYLYSTKIRSSKPYRYVRYTSNRGCYGNVAEIELYNDRSEKLSGKPFGSPADPDVTCDKAFDGDIFTFFDASHPNNAWTGLDLGEPQTIAEIRYFPRHEGNFIYEGHTYELYYWEKDWQLFEQQLATKHFLDFRIPTGGLYYLKSVTKDVVTPWFTLNKNGEQLWL
ncbi:MAG: discoidin domain-containing protein [Prevotellaceae bacterium]|jgi:hypothetical protein|nr:discoidin domain-containing protein [Prevotellaceae bacterium]